MMSADVNTSMKQKIKIGGSSYKFLYKNYLQNLKYNVNKWVYFSFDFGWYSIHFDIVC